MLRSCRKLVVMVLSSTNRRSEKRAVILSCSKADRVDFYHKSSSIHVEFSFPHKKTEQRIYRLLPEDERKIPARYKSKNTLCGKRHATRLGYQRRCILCQHKWPKAAISSTYILPTALTKRQTVPPNNADNPSQPFQMPRGKLEGTVSRLD